MTKFNDSQDPQSETLSNLSDEQGIKPQMRMSQDSYRVSPKDSVNPNFNVDHDFQKNVSTQFKKLK